MRVIQAGDVNFFQLFHIFEVIIVRNLIIAKKGN
jgi:hypothetical protein